VLRKPRAFGGRDFRPYNSLLMPAFSPPGPPGSLTLPLHRQPERSATKDPAGGPLHDFGTPHPFPDHIWGGARRVPLSCYAFFGNASLPLPFPWFHPWAGRNSVANEDASPRGGLGVKGSKTLHPGPGFAGSPYPPPTGTCGRHCADRTRDGSFQANPAAHPTAPTSFSVGGDLGTLIGGLGCFPLD